MRGTRERRCGTTRVLRKKEGDEPEDGFEDERERPEGSDKPALGMPACAYRHEEAQAEGTRQEVVDRERRVEEPLVRCPRFDQLAYSLCFLAVVQAQDASKDDRRSVNRRSEDPAEHQEPVSHSRLLRWFEASSINEIEVDSSSGSSPTTRGCRYPRPRSAAIPLAQPRMASQSRKSPSGARSASTMAFSAKPRAPLSSLPAKMR